MNTTTPPASPTSVPVLSPEQILDMPLPQLLDEAHAEIHTTSVTDTEFFGAVIRRTSGPTILCLPAGRSETQHDTIARYLLAKAFRVDVPELGDPFVTTVLEDTL